MPPGATWLAILALAAGGFSLPNPSHVEVTRGPLAASLTVSPSPGGSGEIVLRVVLRNVSHQRQTFLLEHPGAEFLVKSARGAVVHASVPCFQIGPCDAGLPEATTLEPGGQLEFVELWRPRGGCLAPGVYTVKARLRGHEGRIPGGPGAVRAFASFTLHTDVVVRGGGDAANCARHGLAISPRSPFRDA